MPFEPGKTPKGAIPFEPGQSGNPKGRPKGSRSLSTILREMLTEDIEVIGENGKEKKQFQEVIIRRLIQKANKGDIRAIQEIFDRTEGKAKQITEITIPEKQVIKIGGKDIEF